MKKISKTLSDNPRYRRLEKPLMAAEVCEAARAVGEGRFEVISYRAAKDGLLTVTVESSAAAGNLQVEAAAIIEKINLKIGEKRVGKIRFKIG